MSTVYVVQEVHGRNILPAASYGTLEVLLPAGQVVLSPGPAVNKLRRKLKKFGSGDFLLLIGDPVAIGMAAMVAAEMNSGQVTFLKWDRQERAYYPVKVDLRRKTHDD
jgi:hypothetical protein